MFRVLYFILSIILFAGMLVLSYCNLFLAVHISVSMAIVRVSISSFLSFDRLFAEIVIICWSGVKFVW